MSTSNDTHVLRELARCYAEIAADPIQEERRELWTKHLSLEKTRVPIVIATGFWDLWARQAFPDSAMQCQDPLFREYEKMFRFRIFHATWGDDSVFEPWVTVGAVQQRGWSNLWGAAVKHESLGVDGAAWHFDPVITDLRDTSMLSWPRHEIDEAATAFRVQKLGDAIGDILPINRDRGPVCQGFLADISTMLAQLRGLEQIMVDMCDCPEDLHKILAWMRDGILANQDATEAAGDLSTTCQQNQCMPLSRTTARPAINSHGAKRKDLWAFCAAQEFTGISPAMHDEFLIQYQEPIIAKWGLSAYGCCEDLTEKIDMLRQIRNLRIIAIAPRANVKRCAEQIGQDYVMSWRPNPADVICRGFDESFIRRTISENLSAACGCHVHINLKDVYTLEGDTSRLKQWMDVARAAADGF